MKLSSLALSAAFLLTLFTTPLSADENWNQFRGPNGDGVSQSKGLPVKFKEGSKNIKWKVGIKGRAWSSPIVWGNQVWVTNAPEIQNPRDKPPVRRNLVNDDSIGTLKEPIAFWALCFDLASGKTMHKIKAFETKVVQYTHATNSYGSCTPFVEDGRVYIHFGSYGTACFDTKTGARLWERKDLECHHWRGPGSSPVVHGDALILTFDGYDVQYIVALNKNTGKTLWKTDRGIDYKTDNGDRKKAYSTPKVLNVNGQDIVVSPFAMATTAYALDSGERVWTVFHGGMNTGARPIYGNGLIYICAGSGADSLIAVRPDGHGDVTKSHVTWKQGKQTPRRASQVLLGDRIFMMTDDGVATCLNALTGDIVWTKRVGGRFWASPIAANGLIYFSSQEGRVVVIKAADDYEEVAENQLASGFNASPAVAGDSLILRTFTHLYRIDK
jgi:outer membrane protein assembly factor BamB